MADDPRMALVYDQAVRALDDQRDLVESVRVRAGMLVSAASVATAFLAGLAKAEREGLTTLGWWATAQFALVVILALLILWPTRRWIIRPNAKKLIRDYLEVEPAASLDEMRRDLALHMENWIEGNSIKLRRLFIMYQLASVALGAEVLLWIADLWGR
jgi:hypothetical protein